MESKLDSVKIDEDRRSESMLIDALTTFGAHIGTDTGKKFCCPFHPDTNPSADIKRDEHGIWHFKCWSRCGVKDVWDVRAEINGGRSVLPVLDPNATEKKKEKEKPSRKFPSLDAIKAAYPNHQAVYVYADPKSRSMDMIVVRYPGKKPGDKGFSQFRPH
jgi:hypothetical protein